MKTPWIIGGAVFAAALSWAIGNTLVGIAIAALVGAVAGAALHHLQRRPS